MKITSVLIVIILVQVQCNIMNSLKISNTVKGTVLSAAGKFLNGKSTKAVATGNSVSVGKTSSKSSRMGQLLDIGTNAAMAVAGAGTLFQALSSNSAPEAPPSVSI